MQPRMFSKRLCARKTGFRRHLGWALACHNDLSCRRGVKPNPHVDGCSLQGSSLQGLDLATRPHLADDDLETGPGWQQSRQNQALQPVQRKAARMEGWQKLLNCSFWAGFCLCCVSDAVSACHVNTWPPMFFVRRCLPVCCHIALLLLLCAAFCQASVSAQADAWKIAAEAGLTEMRNTTARGFEPLRAEPNGFRVHLLGHSDTLSWKKNHAAQNKSIGQ